MALVAVGGGGLIVPGPPAFINNPDSGVLGSFLMDASGEKVALGYVVPKTGTLDRVGFLLGTVTQAPVNGLRVSFQDRDVTTGDPDGTQDQFRNVTAGLTSDTWIETGLMTSDGSDTGVKRSVTAGDYLFVVIEFTTFATGDSLNIRSSGLNPTRYPHLHSSGVDAFTAAWAKSVTDSPILYVEYNDGTTVGVPGLYPLATFANTAFGSASAADEIALRFTVPFKCRVSGLWAFVNLANGADLQLVLYDTDGSTVLGSSLTFDEDWGTENGAAGLAGYFTQGPQLLTINSVYRAAVKPTTTAAVTLYEVTQAATFAKVFDAWEGGQAWHESTRADAGAWTQNTLRRPMIGLIVDQLDDGVGAGGGGAAQVQVGVGVQV